MLSVFRHAVAGAREGEAIRYFDGSLTYGDVDELSDAFAVWLAEAGVMRGDRVGIVLQNVPHFLIAVAAAWKLGAIPVPGNPMYKAGELSRIFGDYGPTVVICHDDSASETRRALDDAGLGAVPLASVSPHDFQSVDDARPPRSGEAPIGATADMLALCRERRGRQPASLTLTSEDTGLILYTSGTTGVPKGAVISHGSLAFNGENAARWMRIGRESRILALAPMFHITGFVLHMGLALARGCPVVLHYRFHPEAVLDIIRTARPTFTIAAVTAFNALMNASGAEASDFGSFGQVFTGGAPVAPALREAVRARLGMRSILFTA
jgi:long-chain acyl-CoA synthetase